MQVGWIVGGAEDGGGYGHREEEARVKRVVAWAGLSLGFGGLGLRERRNGTGRRN